MKVKKMVCLLSVFVIAGILSCPAGWAQKGFLPELKLTGKYFTKPEIKLELPYTIKYPLPDFVGKVCPVILNEVLVNSPYEGEDVGEYIELHNIGQESVDIGGWRLSDNSNLNEPDVIEDYTGDGDRGLSGTVIPPGGYAVIVEDDVPMMLSDIIYEDNPGGTYIMVKTGDNSIGNGLANVQDHIRIETDWPRWDGDGNQILRISWDRHDRLQDDENEGRPLQLCDWFHWGVGRWATPGGPNLCQ